MNQDFNAVLFRRLNEVAEASDPADQQIVLRGPAAVAGSRNDQNDAGDDAEQQQKQFMQLEVQEHFKLE